MKRAFVLLLLACATAAHAQPQPAAQAKPPKTLDLGACLTVDTAPGASTLPEVQGDQVATPIPWSEFAIEGELANGDHAFELHAMLEPTLARFRTTLTEKTVRDELSHVVAKLGYQLARYTTDGGVLRLHLTALPIVRTVYIDIPHLYPFDRLFDDELRRRMRLRVGAYLPLAPQARQCALLEEEDRLQEFLHDEGNFSAEVRIRPDIDHGVAKLHVHVHLGDVFHLDLAKMAIRSVNGDPLPIPDEQIRERFKHWLSSRFRSSQFRDDLLDVKRLFQKKGYPGVRVQSSYEPRTSFDRHTNLVQISLTIDPRRYLDIKFVGNDHEGVTDDQLRSQLTFNQAGTTDDVEAASSARALVTYLQQRGFFDARVTWTRKSTGDNGDQITFHIEPGKTREVESVTFVGNDKTGELDDARLTAAVATKKADVAGQLFGTYASASSAQLVADLDRLRELYRRAGYREAQVGVDVTTDPACGDDPKGCALGDAALTAAFIEIRVGDGLYVRFSIEPGNRTMLDRVVIEGGDADAKAQLSGSLCDPLVHELAGEANLSALARVASPACTATAPAAPFREDDLSATRDRLRDYLYKRGSPLAAVDYEARVVAPGRVEAHYTLRTIEQRRVGRILIRGAFKTRPFVIDRLLQPRDGDDRPFPLREGGALTSEVLARAARRLRNTSLFSAVNIELFDLDGDSAYVNVIVRVEERYDNLAQIDLEGGYSSYNGVFATAIWTEANILGTGTSLILTGTTGQKILDGEATLRFPTWLSRSYLPFLPIDVQTELTGLYRKQDTPRFGELTTEGVSAAFTWSYLHPYTGGDDQARKYSIGLHLDYRLRTRNVDTLRPIGADTDDPQAPVSTQTASVGVIGEWEQRVDRRKQLAPLSAEDGFRLFGSVSYALPILGDAEFIKVAASTTWFVPISTISKNLTVRVDARYDEGFPLGGAVLLPDTERFFAGGDGTVRGYNDDAMATEIVRVGVSPLSNISQIRVLPAGGNIRLLGSVDAAYRVLRTAYGDLAGAAFYDAGLIANEWTAVHFNFDSIRPSVGSGMRFLTPFGALALEYAVPIQPHLGDDPRGRIHLYFAARAQF